MKRLFLIYTLGLVNVAYGAVWNRNAATGNDWNLNSNWTLPATFPNGAGSTAIFFNVITDDRTITSGIGIVVGNITIDDDNNYTISMSGNTLTMNNGGTANITVNNSNGNGSHSISAPVSLANPLLFTHNSTANFTISGLISGANGLTKAGTGTGALILSNGSNSYVGTTINAGTLQVSADGNLGTAAGGIIFGGGTLRTTASFTIGAARAISITSAATFEPNAVGVTTTVAGTISGVGGTVTKIGAGTLTLTAANTYSGGTTINNGTLSLSGSGALLSTGAVSVNSATSIFDINAITPAGTTIGDFSGVANSSVVLGTKALTFGTATASTTFAGVISGVGGSTVKQGSGIAVLSGINTYSGGTTINNGTLSLSGSGALLSTGAVSVNSATSVFNISAITPAGTTIGDLSGVASSSVTLGAKALTFGTATASTTFAGVISGAGGSIVKQGSGTAIFSGVNTYTGGTTINAGTLSISANTNLGDAVGNLTFGGGTLQTTTGSFTIGRAISLATAGTFEVVGVTTTLSGVISGPLGTLTKTGTGTLSLTNGANTYTGLTTVNDGTLIYGANGCIFAENSVVVGSGITSPVFSIEATMTAPNAIHVTINPLSTMIGTSGTAIELISLLGSGTLDLGVGTRNINVAPTAVDLFPGRITGGVLDASTDPTTGNRLTKSGTSTLTLTSSTSDFVSRTFVANGVLEVQNGSALGAAGANSGVYIRNATGPATLEINSSITLLKTVFLNGIGFGGNGALRSSSGSNTVSDNVTIGWTGTGEAAADASIQVDAGSLTLSAVVSGSNNLSKTGVGTLTFGGGAPNTLLGTTTVNNGLLVLNKNNPGGGVIALNAPLVINPSGTCQLGAPNQILDTTTVTIAGGTFDMNSNAETIGVLTFNSGTLIQGALLSLTDTTNTTLMMGTGTTVPGSITFTSTGGMTVADSTTIAGTVTFGGAGSVIYTGTLSTSTLSGNVDLGSFGHTFNINNGAASTDMLLSGAISGVGGSITKSTGTGTLEFSGSTSNTYTGLTTISAGTLLLNKSVLNGAIPGNVTINVGGTLLLGTSEQISGSSVVTLSGGTWNMAGFNETIGQLVFSSGNFTQGGGTLTLNSGTNTSLVMDSSTTISGPLAFNGASGITMGDATTIAGSVIFNGAGDIVYNGTTTAATISGPIDLGSFTHTLNIDDAAVTPDMVLSGSISGVGGGITKINTGYLAITGASGNTFSGLTTVSAGTLFLNKSAGNALPGNATVSGGFLVSGAANQISDTSIVTLSGGTWDMDGFSETIGQLLFSSGTLTQGGAILTVTNGFDTAVTMSSGTTISGGVTFATSSGLTMGDGTTISGNLTFQGAGGVIYNGTTTAATISGNIDLGAFSHTFNIADGLATSDMTCSGILSGGASLSKTGAGQLTFSGASSNTFSGPTAVSAGTLNLSKTAGLDAIAGNVLINGGELLLSAPNQIINTATMTISSGSFNMGGALNVETIDSLAMTGGFVTQMGATLTLTSGVATLSMGNATSIFGGTISLSAPSQVLFTGSTGTATISSTINLNANSHIFDINTSTATPAMDIQGVVQGVGGGVTKIGLGQLNLTGGSGNTYTGLTTVSGGVLFLQKTAGNAIPGDLLINSGGTVSLGAANQIIDTPTATITLSGGTMLLNGFVETIGSLIFNSGTLTQGGATLSLTSPAATALSMSDGTVISGPLAYTSTGGLTYTGTSSSATISGSMDLGAFAHTFDIADGLATFDQVISGPISGTLGSITKIGSGTLVLTGANTYGGGTTLTAGTLRGNTTGLQGNILNNAALVFDQAVTGTYAGSINGTGTIDKQGVGTVILSGSNSISGLAKVSAGSLIVNGALAGGGLMTVDSGALLGGTGTITKDVTIQGILSPGNSIGTIHLIGDQVLAAGSILEIELDPTTSDLVDVTGTLTIQPGATLNITPTMGIYSNLFTYTVVQTTGGLSGTFSTVTSTLPLFSGNVVYTPTDVLLRIEALPFIELVATGNAGKVARCLDGFNPLPGSDLSFVITTLQGASSPSDLTKALLQMQPSQYTAIALMQQNNTLYTNEGIFNHLESTVPQCQKQKAGVSIWTTPFTAHQVQKRQGENQGYKATTPGALIGVDSTITDNLTIGGVLGYSQSHLKWTHEIGWANNHSGYVAVYERWGKTRWFIESSLMYGYSHYITKRNIDFTVNNHIDRVAKGHHSGMQGSFHLKTAAEWKYKIVTLSPFGQAAFIYIHEKSFKEKGAQSLNLDVASKNSNLLFSEAGFKISQCQTYEKATFTPYAQVSVVYESRFAGRHEKALFNGCLLNVSGQNPSRLMTGLEGGLNLTLNDQLSTLSLFYKGRFSKNFMDSAVYFQANIKF